MDGLLTEDELWEAEHKYHIISSGFAERVRELLSAYNNVAVEQSVHPTNGGLALRACVNANCGWVGKESACLTWKHAGDERMCPHCHDNTESVSLSAISG